MSISTGSGSESGLLFTMYRGDDHRYLVNVADSDGIAQDITGWTARTTMKRELSDTDEQAPVKVDVVDISGENAAQGTFELLLPRSQTANLEAGIYYFDFQFEIDGLISTLLHGKVRVLADVTQRTA